MFIKTNYTKKITLITVAQVHSGEEFLVINRYYSKHLFIKYSVLYETITKPSNTTP